MAPRTLFCLAPTWTQAARAAFALAAVALAAGCNFKHYDAVQESPTLNADASTCRKWSARPRWDGGVAGSFTVATGGAASLDLCPDAAVSNDEPFADAGSEPACAKGYESAFSALPITDLYSNFDGPDCSSETTNDAGTLTLSGHPASVASVCDGVVRMNGKGNSLQFNGQQYYTADIGDSSLVGGGLTIAAWISIPQNGLQTPSPGSTTVWPIVSTIWSAPGACGGYQLDLRLDCEKGPELAFTLASSDCKNSLVEWPLGNPSWSWGTGRWHYVAATYTPPVSPGKGTLTLYWDGKAPDPDLNSTARAAINNAMGTPSTLYVGTNAQDATNTDTVKFVGNIDEIALFNRSLLDKEIAPLSLAATTVPGPAGCRWRVAELRDEGVSKWSTSAAWKCRTSNSSDLEMTVWDGDWGSGVASARLAPPGQTRDLRVYSHINLLAKIPAAGTYNGDFEVTLHAGDDSCTWFEALPLDADASISYWYTIDLANPGYCQTNPKEHCAFPLDNVEWVSIGSPTEHPVSEVAGRLSYGIDQLKLVPRTSLPYVSKIGGIVGPSNWCWRTEAFQALHRAGP